MDTSGTNGPTTSFADSGISKEDFVDKLGGKFVVVFVFSLLFMLAMAIVWDIFAQLGVAISLATANQ